MSKKCNLVKDILPLYVEDMVSADTWEFVDEHLEHCETCRAELEHMQKKGEFVPDTDIEPLKRIKKQLLIKRMQIIFFTAMFVSAIAVVVFAILTAPDFFPYSDSLVNVLDRPDGTVTITFEDKVTGYNCNKELSTETKTEVYHINAWNTTWDLYFASRGKQNMVISPDHEIQIFYNQNDGSEDVLIYGLNGNADEGITTLPRLILMPYFLLAFLAFVILAILKFIIRNKSAIVMWIDSAILMPISYMAAHLCTKGISFTTYSSQRDFCIIILVAILFYCAMLTGKVLYKTAFVRRKITTGEK